VSTLKGIGLLLCAMFVGAMASEALYAADVLWSDDSSVMLTVQKGPYMTIADDREFVVYDDDGSELVRINPNKNTAYFGKRYSPQGAARAFWDVLAYAVPCEAK